MRVVHVDARDVDGHRHHEVVPCLPVFDLSSGGAPYEDVEALDEAVLLEEGNESAWRYHSERRMVPADEGLGAHQHGNLGLDVEFRLEVHLELLFLDSGCEVVDQALRIQLFFMQQGIVYADSIGEAAANRVSCHLGAVEASLDLECLVDRLIYAHAQPCLGVFGILVGDSLRGLFENGFVILAVGAIRHERVSFASADDATSFAHSGEKLVCDATQHFVTVIRTEPLVNEAEVVDVDDNGIHVRGAVMVVELHGILVKVLAVEQAGQLVAFGFRDDEPVFVQLDCALDARMDDVCLRIGFGDEVISPEVQAFDFGVLVRRRDDDGDVGQFGIGAHGMEGIRAAHDGHLQVQNNERENTFAPARHFQCLFAVFSEEQLVIVLQDFAQDLPVYELVVGNEQQSFPVFRMKFLMAF